VKEVLERIAVALEKLVLEAGNVSDGLEMIADALTNCECEDEEDEEEDVDNNLGIWAKPRVMPPVRTEEGEDEE
jgi:hypothetical protein